MNRAEVHSWMNEQWEVVNRASEESKNSNDAVLKLACLYAALPPSARVHADELIVRWASSADPRRQFDALALIDEFQIETALPVLRVLAERAETSAAPSAPYDWAKVNRIIGRLTESTNPAGLEGEKEPM